MFFRARRYSTGSVNQEKGTSNPLLTATSPLFPAKHHRHLRNGGNTSRISDDSNGTGTTNGSWSIVNSTSREEETGMFPPSLDGSLLKESINQIHFSSRPTMSSNSEINRPTTSSAASEFSQQGVRTSYDRPNSAPINKINNTPIQRFSSPLAQTSQFPTSPRAKSYERMSPLLNGRLSPQKRHNSESSSYLSENENLSTDLTSVEQRLTIIKRNRADRRAVASRSSSSSHPSSGKVASPQKQGALRLLKQEQHVVDAMITQCLDVLLFPSTLLINT